MISFALQSGSNGNCFYVETTDARLLFDAGISGKTAQNRMAHHQRDINDVDALIISHNHMDHVRGAGVFHRKFNLP
ncbi:MAG: MBL fold metallo-hydrolase, partial [Planctomycetes bacterium]|nr:MBL fold metallo-hydrolase [Planctomycetota bacterium]